MLLKEQLDVLLAGRLVLHVLYRILRWILLVESAIYAWLKGRAKPVETMHIVGRFRLIDSELAMPSDFLVFHDDYTCTQALFSSQEWHLYGVEYGSAWFVRSSAQISSSLTRDLFESATKVARIGIRDFLKEIDGIPDNPVVISTLASIDNRGIDTVLSRLCLEGVHVERDPPYLSSLSFLINKTSGRTRRILLEASLRFALRFNTHEKALVTVRSSLLEVVPLFPRIGLATASFLLHPGSPGEAIERVLEADSDYLLMMSKLVSLLPSWILPLLCPTLAVYGDHFLRIAPTRSDECALAVYCRFLQESARLSLAAHSLFERSLQPLPYPREATVLSRSRVRALRRLAFLSIEDDLQWEDDSP
ncbi:hypothetical protein PFISCL1PPCAC_166, partial [Pristionchus fissidentatus]